MISQLNIFRISITSLFLSFTLCSCLPSSEPTLDASNDESVETSFNNMFNLLSPEEKEELSKAYFQIILSNTDFSNRDISNLRKRSKADVAKIMHGLTAKEIIEKAKKLPKK